MYEGKTPVLFAKYAIPQMVGLLFNSVYLIVDGVFIGNRLGRDAMAAAAVSVPLIEILISISVAVAAGAGVMISIRFGRRENENAVRIFNTAVWTMAAVGVGFVILGNLFIHPVARFLGSTPEIHDEAIEYMWHIVTYSPFLMFSFLLGGLARNDGRAKLAMVALALGSVLNIFLDYLFLYPLNMGIGGAALATALGPVFSVVILLPHFLLKKGTLRFARPDGRAETIKRIFLLGFPSFIMEFSIGMATLVYNISIVRHGYGEMGLAAYLVIGYLMLIILTLFLGMAEGLQPLFSYFTGTGDRERNRALRSFSIRIFLGVGILCYLLIVFFARDFYSVFTPGDRELILFAESKGLVYFSGFFLAGFNILMIVFWLSTENTAKALGLSLLRSIVAPPVLITLLPFLLGRESIWLCHSLSETVTALSAVVMVVVADSGAERRNRRTVPSDKG